MKKLRKNKNPLDALDNVPQRIIALNNSHYRKAYLNWTFLINPKNLKKNSKNLEKNRKNLKKNTNNLKKNKRNL